MEEGGETGKEHGKDVGRGGRVTDDRRMGRFLDNEGFLIGLVGGGGGGKGDDLRY
jgi:hypothetical protein